MESHVSSKIVQWKNPGNEVVIISDFPTHEEEIKSLLDTDGGKELESCLPIALSQCTILSLSQHRPDDNDFAYLEGTEALESGLKSVKKYLDDNKSKIKLIISLGPHPLRYLLQKYDINKWRGSPLYYNDIPFLPTYHPKEIASRPTLYPVFAADIDKAFLFKNGKQRIYNDRFSVISDPVEQLNAVEEILLADREGKYITIDIENRKDNLGILCVGFGLSSERAICFVVKSESTLTILKDLLPKIQRPVYHNSLWDISVKRFIHGIESPACAFDTMVAQHYLEPELPKGLDFLCSLYTWRPCYWADITFDEDSKAWSEKASKSDSLWIYNCLDCVVTYESLEYYLSKGVDKSPYFKYKMECLEVAYHMGSTGFPVDEERLALLTSSQKNKRDEDYYMLMHLVGKVINIQSHKKIQEYLYNDLKLPTRSNRKGGITADQDALVSLIGYIKGEIAEKKQEATIQEWKRKLVIVKLILSLRGLEKLLSSYFDITIPTDRRIRSRWKTCGTETGRWSCGLWIDNSGFNAQTLPREVLEINIPDVIEVPNAPQ